MDLWAIFDAEQSQLGRTVWYNVILIITNAFTSFDERLKGYGFDKNTHVSFFCICCFWFVDLKSIYLTFD